MPSAEHESPIALARLDPEIVAWLLANVFNLKLPDYHHIRPHPTDVRVMVPRTYHAEGLAEGVAKGEGQAVLTVLEARGVAVPEAIREQVLACTDLPRLDTWLRRAITASTAEEVVAD